MGFFTGNRTGDLVKSISQHGEIHPSAVTAAFAPKSGFFGSDPANMNDFLGELVAEQNAHGMNRVVDQRLIREDLLVLSPGVLANLVDAAPKTPPVNYDLVGQLILNTVKKVDALSSSTDQDPKLVYLHRSPTIGKRERNLDADILTLETAVRYLHMKDEKAAVPVFAAIDEMTIRVNGLSRENELIASLLQATRRNDIPTHDVEAIIKGFKDGKLKPHEVTAMVAELDGKLPRLPQGRTTPPPLPARADFKVKPPGDGYVSGTGGNRLKDPTKLVGGTGEGFDQNK